MSRFVRPESEKLELTGGDWLLVKRRLTAGEERKAFAKTVKRMTAGGERGREFELDWEAVGVSKVVTYLLDWSLRDDAGDVVPIRDQSAAVVEAALLALDGASFREIHAAITAHEEREAALLEDEKKTRDGGPRGAGVPGGAC